MWRKQKNACLYFEGEKTLAAVVAELARLGYVRCRPYLTAIPRADEVVAMRRVYDSGKRERQVHVQIVYALDERDGPPVFALYAHTEPPVHKPIRHLVAAFRDKMCFRSGARVVKRDLVRMLERAAVW